MTFEAPAWAAPIAAPDAGRARAGDDEIALKLDDLGGERGGRVVPLHGLPSPPACLTQSVTAARMAEARQGAAGDGIDSQGLLLDDDRGDASSKARSDTRSVSSCSPMTMSVMALSLNVASSTRGPNLPVPVPV